MQFEHYLSNLANVVKAGYKSNAFAPLVWFNAIIQPLLYIVIYFISNDIIKYILVAVSSAVLIFSGIMYLVIFLKDPRLLQSERFRIEDKKLDMISQKGSDIVIEPVNLTTPPQLEGGSYD